MNINIQKGSRSPPHIFRGAVACLLLVCFIPLAAVPARADDISDGYGWLELLDYGSLKRPAGDTTYVTGNRTNLATSDMFYFDLPQALSFNYVDIVFYATNFSSISVGYGSFTFYGLTLSKISGNLYRAYGAIEEHTYASLQVKTTSSKAGYINIYSFRVTNAGLGVQDIGAYRWEHTNGGATNSGSANTSGLPKTWTIPWYSERTEFILTIPNAAAKKYDYIDVSFSCNWYAVSAISVTSNRLYIPYEYDYITTEDGQDDYGWLCTTIRIDLTDFISESTDVFLRIEGVIYRDSQIAFQGIKGIVNIRYVDPELYWYQQIFQALTNPSSGSVLAQIRSALEAMAGVVGNIYAYFTSTLNTYLDTISARISSLYSLLLTFKTSVENKFDELISILSPDTEGADQTADELAQRGEEIGGLNNQIDQMERPDTDAVSGDISGIVSGANFGIASTALGLFFNSPVLYPVFALSFMLMLSSYVFFGKR